MSAVTRDTLAVISALNELQRPSHHPLLVRNVQWAQDIVETLVTVPLKSHEKMALVSFCYTLGPVEFTHSGLLKTLNSGDKAATAAEFRKWVKIRTADSLIISTALQRRRLVERKLFTDGMI